jgi:hypothetical protein
MPLKVKDIKEKAFELALIPVEFVLNPIALYLLGRMHIHQEIAKDVLISPDWTIITPCTPLKIKKGFQEVSLVLENCKKTFGKYRENIMFSDGTVTKPAKQIVVEIFDEDGNKYDLKSGSYSVGNFDDKTGTLFIVKLRFKPHKITLPRNKTFKEIKIRSDKTFQIKKIFWHDFDRK